MNLTVAADFSSAWPWAYVSAKSARLQTDVTLYDFVTDPFRFSTNIRGRSKFPLLARYAMEKCSRTD